MFCLGRATRLVTCVTSSAVLIGFMYILKVCSFIHLFNTPPPPTVGTRGLKLEYVLRIPMRLEWDNRKKVGPVLVLCFFISFFFFLLVFVVFVGFFFLLGEFVSFTMYSYSTFVIVVYFIFLSGK